MYRTFISSLFITISIFGTKPAQAQQQYRAIDSLITRSNQLGLFNGNVLIFDQGAELYRKAIGFTDASKQVQLTDQYRFHIGSIAKEFNACAIMMLKEKGKLKLSDKIDQYLPGLPEWSKKIEIINLLQYASGLPDLQWKSISNDRAAIDSIQKIQTLDFEPGTRYAYNNSNTLLQRQIVEKISGMPFADFVSRKMLLPLKMNSSIVDPDDSSPQLAKSYNNSGVASPTVAPISGWTALTLDDFYKWEQNLEHFTLIGPTSTKELLTPFAADHQCGLGGGTMEGDKLSTHVHDGTALNYQALLKADAKQHRTIILMTNNKQNSLYDIAEAIENILNNKPYQQPKKQVIAALQDKLDKGTGTEILNAYRELKSNSPDDYNFSAESALNTVGYTLLAKKRYEEAIVVFKKNVMLFPQSGNVFDSLAEAYLNKGDKANALLNYKRAFELDPTNTSAKEKIGTLQQP